MTIIVFLVIAALMMSCFLGYHLALVARGMTTYETFKRRMWQEEATYATEVEAADRYCHSVLMPCLQSGLGQAARAPICHT